MARALCRAFCRFSQKFTHNQSLIVRTEGPQILKCHRLTPQAQPKPLHTSSQRHDLMEFFDNKANWGEPKITVGRPWKTDELRLKSNTDLHKLWYVLLKERNMVMTMEQEYKAQGELFPNPERLEKVEESMENILEVVRERNRAYNLLETGETGEPGRYWTYNELGVGFWRKEREHYYPNLRRSLINRGAGTWRNKYLRLFREQRIREKRKEERRERRAERRRAATEEGMD